MNLAKRHLDVGLFSNERDEQLAFWQQTVGLPYDHMGKLGGGMQQHRHHMNGSILKMNHARGPLPDVPPSGIIGLEIAREGLTAPQLLADPDGNKVTLVPKGLHGVDGIAILLRVNDPSAHDRFLDARDAVRARGRWPLPLRRLAGGRRRAGQGRERGRPVARARLSLHDGTGWDCLAEYAGILERGGTSGGEPRVLGDTVRYAFVCDPDGNHIEISQRASLTAERSKVCSPLPHSDREVPRHPGRWGHTRSRRRF
jgi:hypothetical protein